MLKSPASTLSWLKLVILMVLLIQSNHNHVMVGQIFYNIRYHTLVDMDWNFGFYWCYFTDISDIEQPRNDFEYQLSNGRNIEKI